MYAHKRPDKMGFSWQTNFEIAPFGHRPTHRPENDCVRSRAYRIFHQFLLHILRRAVSSRRVHFCGSCADVWMVTATATVADGVGHTVNCTTDSTPHPRAQVTY